MEVFFFFRFEPFGIGYHFSFDFGNYLSIIIIVLYTRQIPFHRAKSERIIICRPKENILTEDAIKEGII